MKLDLTETDRKYLLKLTDIIIDLGFYDILMPMQNANEYGKSIIDRFQIAMHTHFHQLY